MKYEILIYSELYEWVIRKVNKENIQSWLNKAEDNGELDD